MTDKLKPCPFCGGEVERDNPMIDYASGHGFHCQSWRMLETKPDGYCAWAVRRS